MIPGSTEIINELLESFKDKELKQREKTKKRIDADAHYLNTEKTKLQRLKERKKK